MRAARFAMLALLASAVFVQTAAALPQFFVKEALTVPRRLAGLAVGDLNGDGIDDIAVISRSNNKISIVLIDENSNYLQAASIILGSRLKSIGIGDFNGDGKGDVVIVTGTRNIFIVPGNGDGTFGASRKIRRCCPGDGVIVGDFDNSRPGAKFGDDFVIANPSKDDVSLFLNKNVALGGIEYNTERRLRAGNKPLIALKSDFNNDGAVDICALNTRGSGNDVSVFVNNGTVSPGTFRSVANFFAGRRARSMAIGDLTADGEEDIVAGDSLNNTLSILPNLGNGFFGTQTAVPVSCVLDESVTPVPCTMRALQIADFDKDDNNDLAVLLSGNNVIRVFQGDAAGGLNNPVGIPQVGADARFMLLGNFNRDDLPDMVVGSRRDTSIRLVINISVTGNGTPIPTATGPTPTATPTNPDGTNTPQRTPTECRGQGCDCDPDNNDDDCNAPFFCAVNDEVCCDTPCEVEDASCSLPGFAGTCKPINLPNGDECMIGDQCVSGFCVDGFCCNRACTGNTEHCDATPGQCIDNGTPRITPTITRTPAVSPTPTLKDLGDPCTAAGECRSTFCPSEDLVCCENACNGANEACDLPTVAGQCLPINVPNNEPCAVDQQCLSEVCDGGLCRGDPTRTPTRTGSAGPTFTPTRVIKPTGEICVDGDECESGFCPAEDEICCNEPCEEPNRRCDLAGARGICTDVEVPDGGDCTLNTQCQSRICEGNICRSAQSRTPTSTRTATRTVEPELIVARGSGCSANDGGGGFSSFAMLLAFPAGWWFFVTRRTPAPVRRRRPRRR